MLRVLYEDLKRIAITPMGMLKAILVSHSFHMVVMIRIGQTASCIPLVGSFIRVLIEYFIRIVYASDISCRAIIGPGLMIMHGHDIVIGANVEIGANCKLFNGVTLGNRNTEVPCNDQPKVGNYVVLGTGAKILGGIQLGDYAKVGANSVVLIDVPDKRVAVGVPAKLV